jgi:hypothetical protein
MQGLLSNWKTSLSGLIVVASVAYQVWVQAHTGVIDPTTATADVGALVAGIGLITAKDFNKQ